MVGLRIVHPLLGERLRSVTAAALIAQAACAGEVARGQHAPRTAILPAAQEPGVLAVDRPRGRDLADLTGSPSPGSPSPGSPSPGSPSPGSPTPATRAAGAEHVPAPATGEAPLAARTAIEDPSGHALAAFHAALGRAAVGEGQARVAFYGASHVASDMFTGPIRERLQQRFGDAGPGFVMPAKPWRWYRHSAFEIERSRGWRDSRVKARAPRDDIYGLMGVALDIKDRFAVAALQTRREARTEQPGLYELWYLRQPKGGRLSVFIDGKRVGKVNTRSDRVEPGYSLFEASEGPHRIELRAHGDGPVRLFGLSVERPTPGVVLDTLGIPGARARYHLHWDDRVYREHLTRRQPDLVVLAYGTNESGDDDVPIEAYEERLRMVLARIRETVPNASCLLVGPSDRPVKIEQGPIGGFEPRPRTAALVESQRRISAQYGCGFFDLVAFMGGEMSMVRWVNADPPLATPDHVHFTRLGYERLADVLHDALLEGYQAAASAGAHANTGGPLGR